MYSKIQNQNIEYKINIVDTHTLGEPTRIVLSGFPRPNGKTMIDRKNHLLHNYDHLRQAILCEPRGHSDMFGAVLMDPLQRSADIGVLFMDTNRWVDMCGHGIIGCATAAVELNLVSINEPKTKIIFETPTGLISVDCEVINGQVKKATFTNVPSFLYKKNLKVTIDGIDIPTEISFGGSFFALVDVSKINFEIKRSSFSSLISLGQKIIDNINKNYCIKHPFLKISDVANVVFYGPSLNKGSDQRNIVISADGQMDRSPCGTGTSARMAALYSHNLLNIGDIFINESFTGEKFYGCILRETQIGSFKAIIPQISGRAYITSFATLIINSRDPLKYGFKL